MQHLHLRPTEYKKLVNRRYVKGCPDGFNFGESAFIPLGDAGRILRFRQNYRGRGTRDHARRSRPEKRHRLSQKARLHPFTRGREIRHAALS
jgi:hypothetical protein